MSNKREFEPIARAFMADGPKQLADRVLESSLAEVHHTRQRRVLVRAPWRTPVMNIYAKLAAAAVVVVAVGALGVWFLSPGSSSPAVGGPPASSTSPSAPPEPSPTPESSPTPSPMPSTPPLSGTFTSTVHGISLATPAEWTTQPATEAWDGAAFPDYGDPSVDLIYHPVRQGELWLMVASLPLGAADPDQWPADQLAGLGCVTVPLSVDGATGLIGATFDRTDCSAAFITSSGRGYLIRLYDSTGLQNGYGRTWFDEVLATVQLHPEDAVDAAPSQ
jgi:hypothetical protein